MGGKHDPTMGGKPRPAIDIQHHVDPGLCPVPDRLATVQAAEGSRPSEEAAISALMQSETLSLGEAHTCAIKSDGTLACWGENANGQSTPPIGTFTQVSAGGSHTCG
ncbi:MAG: RCC1 domain-containing protein, partial [Anaerolineaceae bacterium]